MNGKEAEEMTMDMENRETMLEALDIAKDKFFIELLDMNRQRVEEPDAWNEKTWLKLTKKYNAVSKMKSDLMKERELAEA